MPNKMVCTILVLTNISALTDGGFLLCLVTHILSVNDFLKVAQQQCKGVLQYASLKNCQVYFY